MKIFYSCLWCGCGLLLLIIVYLISQPKSGDYLPSETFKLNGGGHLSELSPGKLFMTPTVHLPKDRFRIINSLLKSYDPAIADLIKDLVDRKAPSQDPQLVDLARRSIDPPSEHMTKFVHPVVATPQAVAVIELLGKKRNGFFVEVGGLDGERSSNTKWLETELNWTGLLIEMDPYFYTQLLGKNRRCFSINACLSPYQYATKIAFKEDRGGRGRLTPEVTPNDVTETICFPLETLLLALNRSQVDFFSLDVEGLEMPILQALPWERIGIQTMAVEYVHGKDKKELRAFVESKGYTTFKDIHFVQHDISLYVDDLIFNKTR